MRLETSKLVKNDAVLAELFSGEADDAGDLLKLMRLGNVIVPTNAALQVARSLLQEFGTFAKVMYAPVERLRAVEGITRDLINLINITRDSVEYVAYEAVNNAPIIGGHDDVVRYIRVKIGHHDIEKFHVLFMNAAHRLIKDEILHTGSINHTPVYPYMVTRRAVMLGASAVIIAHNHPSDDCSPSPADIFITKCILQALMPVDVKLHDHVIVAGSEHYSFKSAGLL